MRILGLQSGEWVNGNDISKLLDRNSELEDQLKKLKQAANIVLDNYDKLRGDRKSETIFEILRDAVKNQ